MIYRVGTVLAAIGMAIFSILTMQHFFITNYPAGGVSPICEPTSQVVNCAAAASSPIAQVAQIPIGYFGLATAIFFVLGAVFASREFQATIRFVAVVNLIGVFALLGYSVFRLHTICPLCAGYYVSSLLATICLFIRQRDLFPSLKHLIAFCLIAALGGWGVRDYHAVRRAAASRPAQQAAPFSWQ